MLNRRAFLQATTAAATAHAAANLLHGSDSPQFRAVDTHTHFYDPTRAEGVPWPDKKSPLFRPVLPRDWQALATPVGVRETVVVEASAWLEDNAWILNLAAVDKSIVGFIGHLLPHDTEFAAQLKRFAADPIFRGIRVSGANFAGNVEKAEFQKGIKLLADGDLTLELNGPATIHAAAAKIAAEMPSLRIMIDHVGGAGDPMRLSDEWRNGMKQLGKHANVFCKVSALMEQSDASRKEWGTAPRDTDYYRPILDHCRDCFGEDRLVYGSNWPVCERGGSYADQFRIVKEYFGTLGPAASEKYFWKNSRQAYRWLERA